MCQYFKLSEQRFYNGNIFFASVYVMLFQTAKYLEYLILDDNSVM